MKTKDPDHCPEDYMNQHCWKNLGVCAIGKNVYEIWQCTQCQKSLKKKLEFVEVKR